MGFKCNVSLLWFVTCWLSLSVSVVEKASTLPLPLQLLKIDKKQTSYQYILQITDKSVVHNPVHRCCQFQVSSQINFYIGSHNCFNSWHLYIYFCSSSEKIYLCLGAWESLTLSYEFSYCREQNSSPSLIGLVLEQQRQIKYWKNLQQYHLLVYCRIEMRTEKK